MRKSYLLENRVTFETMTPTARQGKVCVNTGHRLCRNEPALLATFRGATVHCCNVGNCKTRARDRVNAEAQASPAKNSFLM